VFRASSNHNNEDGKLSEKSVLTSIEAYDNGVNHKRQIFDWSEKLRSLKEEIANLAIESIARFQPVAGDLRFIRSCMELAYGFSRFGRYAYDIVDVLETIGPISACDKTAVLENGMRHKISLLNFAYNNCRIRSSRLL